ncbi:MAG: manganese efflux pump [Candidatus Aminicenantes bacterium]|nr:MAG: manganese efflux pump [Candidatus Aminicenantes bacterium]
MDLISTVVLAVGLSMDAFAVSISSSFTLKEIKWKHALKFGLFFGVFQAIMPLFGWLAGIGFRDLIQEIDHWIAFGLLALIGGKMILGSFKKDCNPAENDPLKLHVLLGLSVATSIDALAAGVSFGLLKLNILTVVTIIGAVTFALSAIGARIGRRLGCRFGERVELVGGIILISIGIKIVIEHIVNKI